MTARILRLDGGEHRSGLRSSGAYEMKAFAFCGCGWRGSPRRLRHTMAAGVRQELELERAAHEEASGHRLDDAIPPWSDHHLACGFYHGLNDACPLPTDSAGGRLLRAMIASTPDPTRSLDRLMAISELRTMLDHEERQAVIGARMARCAWVDLANAMDTTKGAVLQRFGDLIARYEAVGLLPRDGDDTPGSSRTSGS